MVNLKTRHPRNGFLVSELHKRYNEAPQNNFNKGFLQAMRSVKNAEEEVTAHNCTKYKYIGPARQKDILKILQNIPARKLYESKSQQSESLPSIRVRKKKKVASGWKPKKNSCTWALMIWMWVRYRKSGEHEEYTKDQIIDGVESNGGAQMYARHSFREGRKLPGSNIAYSGWAGVQSLINKGFLNIRRSRKHYYSVTELGAKHAHWIWYQNAITEGEIGTESYPTPENPNPGRIAKVKSKAKSCSKKTGPAKAVDLSTPLEFASASRKRRLPMEEKKSPPHKILKSPLTSLSTAPQYNNIGLSNFDQTWIKTERALVGCSLLDSMGNPQNHLKLVNDFQEACAYQSKFTGCQIEIFDPSNVILLVDTQERNATSSSFFVNGLLKSLDGPQRVQRRRLALGDFLWVYQVRPGEQYILPMIAERKAMDDLSKSLRDLRYKEQKYRMINCQIQYKIYLVEGDINREFVDGGSLKKGCSQAVVETLTTNGFQVLETKSKHESLVRLAHLTYNLIRAIPQMLPTLPELWSYKEFDDAWQRTKPRVTREGLGCQLAMVRGITPEVATALVSRYPTPKMLLQALREKNGLKELRCSGQTCQKLGKKVEELQRFFLGVSYSWK